MEKQCSKCKVRKNISEFHKTKYQKDGYKTECKQCRKIYAKQKRVEKGGTNQVDRSIETDVLKICTNCKELKNKNTQFNNHSSWCLDCRNNYHRIKYNYKSKFKPIITNTQKQCCKCKELKNLEEYSSSKKGLLGLSSYCKPCASKRQLEFYTKEQRRIKTQKYRDSNREWWRSLHRINQFNRRENIKIVSDDTITSQFIEKIYSSEFCYYCNESTPRKFRTLEHKQSLKRGGKHSANNIVMACSSCNCSKGKMTEQEFKIYDYYKKNTNVF